MIVQNQALSVKNSEAVDRILKKNQYNLASMKRMDENKDMSIDNSIMNVKMSNDESIKDLAEDNQHNKHDKQNKDGKDKYSLISNIYGIKKKQKKKKVIH